MTPTPLYGRHPVLEALEAGEAIGEILVAEGTRAHGNLARIVERARERGVPVKWVPLAALARAAGGGQVRHQGVVALVAEYAYRDLNEILAVAVRRGEPPFLLALDGIQDVHNLGALLRSAEAAGMHGALLGTQHAAGITAAVRKTSAGAVAHLAVARVELPEALDGLRQRGVTVVGLDAAAPLTYTAADLSGPLALVIGGEAQGLRTTVRRHCDHLVSLPMRGRVASLNASVAGAIVVYEAVRQRGV